MRRLGQSGEGLDVVHDVRRIAGAQQLEDVVLVRPARLQILHRRPWGTERRAELELDVAPAASEPKQEAGACVSRRVQDRQGQQWIGEGAPVREPEVLLVVVAAKQLGHDVPGGGEPHPEGRRAQVSKRA